MKLPSLINYFRFSPALHWPWLAGFAVLCFAAVVSLGELPALRLQNSDLERQIKSLEAQSRKVAADSSVASKSSFDMRAPLADQNRLSVIANDFQAAAVKNGLTLSDVVYKPVEGASITGVGSMEIDVNLKGTYLPLKKMLAELLASHDGLALESVSLRRHLSTDSVLDIEARFTFFYRKRL